MNKLNFEASLAIILREEGGNDDDPQDHGGRTSRGIIQREWEVFRIANPGRPLDVWKASDADIATIYHTKYWLPYCDQLSSGVDLCFFNMAVNSGVGEAAKLLQRALGVKDDGRIGPVTLSAANVADAPTLVHDFSEQTRRFYRGLSQFPRYGRGWLGRTDRIELSAKKMAIGGSVSQVADTHATPVKEKGE